MYHLVKVGKEYEFSVGSKRYKGSLKALIQKMLTMGFKLPDIEDGIVALDVYENKRVVYDGLKKIIYSA